MYLFIIYFFISRKLQKISRKILIFNIKIYNIPL